MRLHLFLLLLPLAALALPAHAQAAVSHCVDSHGTPVFTDQPCSALQATPVQSPTTPANALPPGAPVPLARCAATPDALRQRVIDAFATRDPNQLAGLMLWHGYAHGAAAGDIRALAALVRRPLLQIRVGADDPASAGSTAIAADTLQVQTSDGGNASFVIARAAGCLWLRQTD